MEDILHGRYGTREIIVHGIYCTWEKWNMGDMVHGDIVHGRYGTWEIWCMGDMVLVRYGTSEVWYM